MYSVVGAPTIGFDLARLDGGAQVAAVLRAALTAGEGLVARLASGHPGGEPRAAWRRACEAAGAGDHARDLLPRSAELLTQAAAGETALLRRLEASPLGDAAALDRLVRRELLDWTWQRHGEVAVQGETASRAADVLVDAAVAGFLRDRLSVEVRRQMAAAYVAAVPASPPDSPTGLPDVDRRLAVLGVADAQTRAAWRRVVEEQRVHTAAWAPAMHQATWALALTDRLRAACGAQLAAVEAFRRAGFTGRDAAYGVWNAVSGVLQASAVPDLLPAAEAEVLLRPWRAVYGTG